MDNRRMLEATIRELVYDLFSQVTGAVEVTRCIEEGESFSSFRDMAAVVRHYLPDRIATNFSTKQGRVEVFQLKCLEQRASGYCGHYAIFFALKMLEACQCKSVGDLCCYIRLTSDLVSFWKRYWKSVALLLDEASQCHSMWWPWTKEHIVSGDMERSFLTFILTVDPEILTLNANNNIQVLHYAYGLLQSSEEEVCAVQRRISKFLQSYEDWLVFILGVTNHWVTLVAHKSYENGMTVLYLDSNNEPVLLASDTHLENLVQAREIKHTKRKGQPYSQWKRKVLYQSFEDQRDVVNLLVRCISGEKDLRGELTTQSWTKLLDSYYQHVGGRGDDPDLHLACLIEWLEDHYPSKVIHSHHLNILSHFHGLTAKEVLVRIDQWSKDCDNHSKEKECGLENVVSFYSTLHMIMEITGKSIND